MGQPHTSAECGCPQVGEKGREEDGRKCVGRGCGETGPSSGLSTPEVARFLFVLSTLNPSPQSAGAKGWRRERRREVGEVEAEGEANGETEKGSGRVIWYLPITT